MTAELLVAGSIALDTLSGDFGTVEDELGGSALFFALAANLLMPVTIVAPTGVDCVDRVRDLIGGRTIDTAHLAVLDAPTFRWRAKHVDGRNFDLGSQDEIYDHWTPTAPERFAGWGFVGSVRPDQQLAAMELLGGAQLLAADAMMSYVSGDTTGARDVVLKASWYFCNHEEFAALGGHDAEEYRTGASLDGLVLKSGPLGATAFTAAGPVHVPALLNHPVLDTTGAGDALAAGMLARWLLSGADPDALIEAMVWGVACASITIEDIGLRAIARATRADLDRRVVEVRAAMSDQR